MSNVIKIGSVFKDLHSARKGRKVIIIQIYNDLKWNSDKEVYKIYKKAKVFSSNGRCSTMKVERLLNPHRFKRGETFYFYEAWPLLRQSTEFKKLQESR